MAAKSAGRLCRHVTIRLSDILMLSVILIGNYDDSVTLSRRSKVPIFYAANPLDDELFLADFIGMVTATLFGAIHCIAWSFTFLSDTERLLWRISSLIIVGGPSIWAVIFLLAWLKSDLKINKRWMIVWAWGWWKGGDYTAGWDKRTIKWVGSITGILCFISIIAYIVARIILLVIAFLALRSLSVSAYQTVTWTTFIPHI